MTGKPRQQMSPHKRSGEFTPKLITTLRQGYGLKQLRADALAGLTLAIIALPLATALGTIILRLERVPFLDASGAKPRYARDYEAAIRLAAKPAAEDSVRV